MLVATDTERDRVSMLVRLAPGASYPAHTHAGVEELHLLDGEPPIGPTTACLAGNSAFPTFLRAIRTAERVRSASISPANRSPASPRYGSICESG
jgi:ChrR-like protein with cupin domain